MTISTNKLTLARGGTNYLVFLLTKTYLRVRDGHGVDQCSSVRVELNHVLVGRRVGRLLRLCNTKPRAIG